MKRVKKALWGVVSHDRDTFTLHYADEGNSSCIYMQGYSEEIFQGLDIPIIRFDLADIDNVFKSLKCGDFYIKGYHGENCIRDLYPDMWITVDEYLDRISKFIPVDNR